MNIAFIPLRGGSKSIPGKNIKLLLGKPLATYSIDAAVYSKAIDKVIIATDSSEIIQIVSKINSSKIEVFHRSAENAQDNSSTESVMLEYINSQVYSENDLFILIQATNPFITSVHLDEAIAKYDEQNLDSMLSCVEFKRFIWNDTGEPMNYNYKNRLRRQDFPPNYLENGSFYISTVGGILETKNRLNGRIGYYIMPEYSSYEIDEPSDWLMIEMIMLRVHSQEQFMKQKVKLFFTDVDGVLTDSGMYYAEDGKESKKFNTRDGMGMAMLRSFGIPSGIITSENTTIVANRARKLKTEYLYQGVENKLKVITDLCKEVRINLNEVAYIGDDLNDYELLLSVGTKACPADAIREIRSIPGIQIMTKGGGGGCVREFVDSILEVERKAKTIA